MPTAKKLLSKLDQIKLSDIAFKQRILEQARVELKQQFIGIDYVIDDLIEYIKIWYLMPQLLTRPLIVNLWGMTGVGKTDLIRSLIKKLQFQDRFVEIELSNSSRSSYYASYSSIAEIFDSNGVSEHEPSVVLFDEIQRFNTIDDRGSTVEDVKFQDFWELLSDGKLAKRDKVEKIDYFIADLQYWIEARRRTGPNSDGEEEGYQVCPNYDQQLRLTNK